MTAMSKTETHSPALPDEPADPAGAESARNPAAPTPGRKRSPLRWIVGLLIVGAMAWWGTQFLHHMLTYETTDDAYIRTHVHQVATRVSGTVSEVLVKDHE